MKEKAEALVKEYSDMFANSYPDINKKLAIKSLEQQIKLVKSFNKMFPDHFFDKALTELNELKKEIEKL